MAVAEGVARVSTVAVAEGVAHLKKQWSEKATDLLACMAAALLVLVELGGA